MNDSVSPKKDCDAVESGGCNPTFLPTFHGGGAHSDSKDKSHNNQLDDCAIARLLQRIANQEVAAVGELFDNMSTELGLVFQSLTDAAPQEPLIEDVFWEIWLTAARFTPDSDSAYRWIIGKVASRVQRPVREYGSVTDLQPEIIWRRITESAKPGSNIHKIVSSLSQIQLKISAQCLFLGLRVDQAAEINCLRRSEVIEALNAVKTLLSGACQAPSDR